jgi:hypothetical protein
MAISRIHLERQAVAMQHLAFTKIGRIALAVAGAAAVHGAAGDARAETPHATAEPRDGQHDFDFELGSWKMHLKKLKSPLHGSHDWIEFDGTSVTRPLWSGRSQVEEFEVDSAEVGHIEGMTVRLYSTATHQWSLNWANQKVGRFDVPTVGEFNAKGDRGEFFDQEIYEGRAILVRYVWSNITPKSAHFEQSFSADGGKTWEVNWITQQTRVE